MDSLPRALMIWDGECGFCRRWIERMRRATGERVDYAPYQEIAARFPEVPLERFRTAIQLIEPDGRWSQGAEAVLRALANAPGHGWALALYRRVPGVATAAEWAYARVARHRGTFSIVTRWLWGDRVVPPGEATTCVRFLRMLGIVYFLAFVSLGVQIVGLVGAHGILPAGEYLGAVRSHYGALSTYLVPSLFWIGVSDAALRGACAAGAALSLLLITGIAPGLCLALLWILYLSVVSVGQDFLWFQWDGLLLEAGLVAIFLVPWRWRWRGPVNPAPARPALWLLRWLLFRLMVSSAAVKLLSGDPTWRNLTALGFHFETQPIPPWTAWHVHQLPAAFHRVETITMFVIEGIVPFFLIGPRHVRFAAAALLVGFQTLIALTGNYGFFNVLTIALCALFLDDAAWPRRVGRVVAEPEAARAPHRRWPGRIGRAAAIAIFIVSLVPFFGALHWPAAALGPIVAVDQIVAPLRIVNSYGLFAVMTTRRPEIVVEGSDDGAGWRAYEFKWKAGDIKRAPPFVAPHMPRLDWQMWFAALGDFRRDVWFLRFCERLLQGSRPVLALLESNPFPAAPPRYIRATVYDYHFTDAATRRATGAWWRREPRGLYCPVLTLENGRLAVAPIVGGR